jgi:hypothetical protein
MTSEGLGSGSDLIKGITQGKVPREVRLFAAQGLLPVPREDLLSLQTLLSSDPDKELAEVARQSLEGEDAQTILDWLNHHPPEPLVLDQLIRVRTDESVWAAVAAHSNVSDETLRVIARHASPLVQDIIITNQVRLLGCLDILEDLRDNPEVSSVVLRRVREFETEFIEKALAEDDALESMGPSVEEAIESLNSIGAHIPKLDTMPYATSEDAALADAIESANQSVHQRILEMSVHERIICALRGNQEERAILINSRNRLIQRSVLACPKLNDNEIERFASSRSVSEEVIRLIGENQRWLRMYPVLIALAMNPKTPVYTAKSILPRLNHRDRVRVTRNRNLNPVTRKMAEKLTTTRR